MGFIEFVGPEKALVFGIAVGFAFGCLFTLLVEFRSSELQHRSINSPTERKAK